MLQKMFKDDYNSIINFLSYRLKNPMINVKLAFVLYGINKSGKSTFVNSFLPSLFGKQNVKGELNIIKTEDLTFNQKFIGRMFTCFEEFFTDNDSLVDKFKNMITADSYDVNEKFMVEYEMPHYNTYILNTNNYPQWLEKEAKSGRFIVLSINIHINFLFLTFRRSGQIYRVQLVLVTTILNLNYP